MNPTFPAIRTIEEIEMIPALEDIPIDDKILLSDSDKRLKDEIRKQVQEREKNLIVKTIDYLDFCCAGSDALIEFFGFNNTFDKEPKTKFEKGREIRILLNAMDSDWFENAMREVVEEDKIVFDTFTLKYYPIRGYEVPKGYIEPEDDDSDSESLPAVKKIKCEKPRSDFEILPLAIKTRFDHDRIQITRFQIQDFNSQ